MTSLPNETLSDITNFLPNDDITDMMLMSRTFNALVTPRLKKINKEMTLTNQSIKSFMPSPAPDRDDTEWISQLDLKRFEPIGLRAKKRMKKVFDNHVELRDCVLNFIVPKIRSTLLPRVKEKMSLERFDNPTFFAFWVHSSQDRNSVKNTMFGPVYKLVWECAIRSLMSIIFTEMSHLLM